MFDLPLRRELRERTGLKGTTLNLLTTILFLSRNEDGRCYARVSSLGRLIERAERTVRIALARLRKLNFVHTTATGRAQLCTPVWETLGMEPLGIAGETADRQPRETSEGDAPRGVEQGQGSAEERAEDLPESGTSEASAPAVPESVLAEVGARFGADAQRDVADVLERDARATGDVARDAVDRLLEVDPARIEQSAGGYFRRLLDLASTGRLSAKKSSAASTHAPGPLDEAMSALRARLQAVNEQLEHVTLCSERHRDLSEERDRLIDEQIRRRAKQDAQIRAHAAPPPQPSSSPPLSPPPRAGVGPLPSWLRKYIPPLDEPPGAHGAPAPS